MNTVREIEQAVSQLSPEQFASFRKWLDEFEAKMWDKQFEVDAMSGKLDKLADQAISDFRAGKCVELSQAGKKKLGEALIEMEQGKTKEFDSVDDLIKDLLLTCGTHDEFFK